MRPFGWNTIELFIYLFNVGRFNDVIFEIIVMFQFNGWDKLNLNNPLFGFVHEMDHQFLVVGYFLVGDHVRTNLINLSVVLRMNKFESLGLFPESGFSVQSQL